MGTQQRPVWALSSDVCKGVYRHDEEVESPAWDLIEAAVAAADGYTIVTISLGGKADTGIMEQIATIGGGVHYQIPGGLTVAEVAQELEDVFVEIGANRSIELVR